MSHRLPGAALLATSAILVLAFCVQCTRAQSGQTTPEQSSTAGPPRTASPPIQILVTGCLKRASDGGYYLTDANATTWQLSSNTVNLADHVMHAVSIAGKPASLVKSQPSASEPTGKPGNADNSAHQLQVITLKMLSNSCTR